jgi:hypothetical protein
MSGPADGTGGVLSFNSGSCYSSTSYSKCDINEDGNTNSSDVLSLIDIILERESNSQGDINSDSIKDVLDLYILLSVVYHGGTCPS